jgi:CubicO group peptidase (beta-lactamase class C family)
MDILKDMVNKIYEGEFGNLHSLLISKSGKLIFEEYFDGFYRTDLHALRSCTKSIASLLIGIAIDNGFVTSIDEKVIDFYPEHKEIAEDNWNNVSIKDILTMSAGLDWDNQFHDNIWDFSDDVIKSTFEQSFKAKPGELFEYRNPNVDLLSGIISGPSNLSVQKFAEKYLFAPLGITNYRWENFKSNNYPLLDGSLILTPRDMMKIGLMVRNKGMWEDQQIVSEAWIDESTSFKISTDNQMEYGYLWWIEESKTAQGIKAIFAHGIGGQHIVIVPQLDLTIVTTAGNFMGNERTDILTMIDEYIIKSFVN